MNYENKEITKQGKVDIQVNDIDNSILLFKKLDFKELNDNQIACFIKVCDYLKNN